MQIGICDDSREDRERLRGQLERIAPQWAERILEFSSGEGLLRFQDKHRGEIDLLFLDIEMSGISGMETAHRLRRWDAGVQIAFVTGYSDYVYDGYAVSALGYLLKPPTLDKLRQLLERAREQLDKSRHQAFVFRSGESSYRIEKRSILYFYSDRRRVHCQSAGAEHVFYGKLDQVEQELADENFVRIHQRYLVNASAVQRLDGGEALMVDGRALPISRSCRDAALAQLTRAMLK